MAFNKNMHNWQKQIASYAIVGVSNTIITLVVIAALTWLNISPLVANVLGFSAGLLNSYLLNKKFTFRRARKAAPVLEFFSAFGISYGTNVAVLMALIGTELPLILCQILAMAAYNICFFLLMKIWVFHG